MNESTTSTNNQTSLSLTDLAKRLEVTEANLQVAQDRYQKSERRFRTLSGVLLVGITGNITLSSITPATAQSFNSILIALQNRVTALETKTQDITRLTDPNTSKTTVRFSGVNVQVVSGVGTTGGTVNGTGNIIVGYNETRVSGNDRSGSHNIVLGASNNYSSFNGIVSGDNNSITGIGAIVLGGAQNTSSGSYSAILSGVGNAASNNWSTIAGGWANEATADRSVIVGGQLNKAHGYLSIICGGIVNTTTTASDVQGIFGGGANTATGSRSAILGGVSNTASSEFSTVVGGQSNSASGYASSVTGGNGAVQAGNYRWRAGNIFSTGDN